MKEVIKMVLNQDNDFQVQVANSLPMTCGDLTTDPIWITVNPAIGFSISGIGLKPHTMENLLPMRRWQRNFLVLGVYEFIYEIFNKEEFNMNLYDKENNCFVPNPPAMRYWEIITKISAHKNVSLKEATKEFFELSGVPSNEILEIILNADKKDLIPFGSKIKICDDEDTILSYGIQPDMAGKIGYIKDIAIDDGHFADDKEDKTRNRVYYLIDIDDSLYSCEILNKV